VNDDKQNRLLPGRYRPASFSTGISACMKIAASTEPFRIEDATDFALSWLAGDEIILSKLSADDTRAADGRRSLSG
jgi:hypothetical protein